MVIWAFNSISKSSNSEKSIFYVVAFGAIFSVIAILFFFFNYLQSSSDVVYDIFILIIDPLMLFIFFVSELNHKSYNRFFYILEDVIIVLALMSLMFWIFTLINIPTNTSKVINWGGIKSIPGYFGLDFIAQGRINFLGLPNVTRNTGIFTEAPMYNYILCIGLLIELFFKKHACSWKVLILFITILSTTSTTGLLVAVPAILYKLFFYSNNYWIKVLILVIVPLILIFAYIVLNNKIGNVNNELSSYNMRKNDIISCIYAWKEHIWIGNGLNNTAPISQYGYLVPVNGILTQSAGGSNGIFMVLALGGIIYASFYVVPTILFAVKSYKSLAVAIFTFTLLIYTVIYNSFICIILLSYFWAYSLCKSHKKFLS